MASTPFIDELLSKVNIEDLIGEVVPLTRKGGKLWACCPFHSEKTPSFSVSPDKGMFYCFGCHKGGNAITFVREYEHMESFEAIKYLAERAHMQLPERRSYDAAAAAKQSELKENIYSANLFAARYFHSLIWTNEGAEALNYLHGRGLTDADIKHFGLGAAPLGRTDLYEALKANGFSDETIFGAWLAGQKEGRKYDMFRGRVIFPIINPQGKVLGFGGRIMGKGEPKYLNTSDTEVFNKRKGLYGLNFAKAEHGLKRLILVEGYMDTVMTLKHGIPGVVATLGTALTPEQVLLMKRYVREVVISYDGDGAGRKAALRALDMIEPEGLNVRVIDYPNNMDPDEYLKAYGREQWEALPRLKANEYRMARAKDDLDLSTQEGMTEYAVRCCTILKTEKNAVEYENMLRRLCAETGYSRQVLERQIGQAKLEPERIKPPAPPKPVGAAAVSPIEAAQLQLIALIAAGKIPKSLVRKEDFDYGQYAELFELLQEGDRPRDFIESIPEEQREKALAALNFDVLPEDKSKATDMANELLRTIRRERMNGRISEINERLKTATGEERQRLIEMLNRLALQD